MYRDATRRQLGLFFGTALGFIYGLVSQNINALFLPGVPLYQPPFGPLGNIALCTLAGLVLGLVSAWPESLAVGSLAGGAAAGTFIVSGTLMEMPGTPAARFGMVTAALFLLLPLSALAVPFTALLRWGVNKWQEGRVERLAARRRAVPPLILLLVVCAAAVLPLYRADARQILSDANTLVRAGLAVTDPAGLPAPLQAVDSGAFFAHARGPYTLQWSNSNLNQYRIPRPTRNFDAHSVAIARFPDGWQLVCLYIEPGAGPSCKGFIPGEDS